MGSHQDLLAFGDQCPLKLHVRDRMRPEEDSAAHSAGISCKDSRNLIAHLDAQLAAISELLAEFIACHVKFSFSCMTRILKLHSAAHQLCNSRGDVFWASLDSLKQEERLMEAQGVHSNKQNPFRRVPRAVVLRALSMYCAFCSPDDVGMLFEAFFE